MRGAEKINVMSSSSCSNKGKWTSHLESIRGVLLLISLVVNLYVLAKVNEVQIYTHYRHYRHYPHSLRPGIFCRSFSDFLMSQPFDVTIRESEARQRNKNMCCRIEVPKYSVTQFGR